MRTARAVPLLVAALAWTGHAGADEPKPAAAAAVDPEQDAAAHFAAGQKAFDDEDSATAVDELEKSVAAKPTAKALRLLGDSYVKLGRLDDARAAFQKYLELEPRSSKRAAIEKQVKELAVLSRTKIKVTSSPPGATVYIDLEAEGPHGKTPADVPVAPGRHRVILVLDGYRKAIVSDVNAVEGSDVTLPLQTLVAKGCDVTVHTTPVATVQVDGRGAVTPTPATIHVPLGEHQLVLSGDGVKTDTRTLQCTAEKPATVEVALEPVPVGLVRLHAPADATVTVDGKPASAGDAQLSLDPGEHAIDVSQPGKAPWHVVTKVRAGVETELTPRLDVGGAAGGSTLLVDTPARNATVSVDGKAVPVGAEQAVAPGRHRVRVSGRGWATEERGVSVGAGQSVRVDVPLHDRGRALLHVAVASLVLAAGAEAIAIVGHVEAGREIANSPDYTNRWHPMELWGQVAAGSLAAIGVASLVAYILITRHGPEGAPSLARVRPGVGVARGGGVLSLEGSF